MKLLLDQGLPRSTASILRGKGLDAVHVGELEMWDAEDEAILAYAVGLGYGIVTLDADFQAMVALSQASTPTVIRLRVQRLKAIEAAELVMAALEHFSGWSAGGCFITVTSKTIRVRKLPIGTGGSDS